ncbi:Uncharacterized protein dnm_092160 [Desulfonema magnum]|uniref:Uncharacterized protein n=1 Tax=Desulfonema magnum TaxID=45655 RepID=A0A975GTI8_9BACT|nr:Uncharacterized protein dnm_092160 [Desulfonema magnum]
MTLNLKQFLNNVLHNQNLILTDSGDYERQAKCRAYIIKDIFPDCFATPYYDIC